MKEEDLLDKIGETIPVGLTFVDSTGAITFANITAEKILKLTKGKIKERYFNDNKWQATDFDGNPLEEDEYPFSIVQKTKSPLFDYRHAIRGPEGQIVLLSINATPLFNESGKFKGMIATIEDITNKIEAEAKLVESEEKFRSIFEAIPRGMFLYHLDDKNHLIIRDTNPAAREILGIDTNKFIGKTVEEAFPVLKDTELPEKYRKIARNGGSSIWHQFRYEDEEIMGVYEVLAFQTSQNNVLASFQDITKRRETEKKIKESERRFRTLAENVPGTIYLCRNDARWTMLFLNDEVEKLTGYSKELFLNDKITFVDLYHPDDKGQIFKEVDEALQIGGAFHLNYRIKHKSGEWRWVYEVGQAIYNDVNEIEYLEGYLTDITENRLAQEKIKSSENQYREAYRRAEFYKDLFAHDINNILQSIKTANELAEIMENQPNHKEDIKNIRNIISEQIERGANLVNNIRKLSLLEEKGLSIRTIDLIPVLNEVIKSIKSSLYCEKVKIQTNISENAVFVKANDFLIDIFENILDNSIRHNPNENIEISINVGRLEENSQNQIRIEIIDNGMGIHDNWKKAIFQRDYNDTEEKGLGLGLSLVNKILQSYGGKIWVEDRVSGQYKKGSKFIILLPEAN